MSITGDYLAQERSNLGYSLEDIENITRIRRQYLEALETGNFVDLPPQVYAIGFVKRLAQLLELDADLVTAWFKHEALGDTRPQEDLPAVRTAAQLAGVRKVSAPPAPASSYNQTKSQVWLPDEHKTVAANKQVAAQAADPQLKKKISTSKPVKAMDMSETPTADTKDSPKPFQVQAAPSTYQRRFRGSINQKPLTTAVSSKPKTGKTKEKMKNPKGAYKSSYHQTTGQPAARKQPQHKAARRKNPFSLSYRNLFFSVIFLIIVIWAGNLIGQKFFTSGSSSDITQDLQLRPSHAQWLPPVTLPDGEETNVSHTAAQDLTTAVNGEGINLKISVLSNMECWMEITADGEKIFSDTVKGGTSKDFKASEHMTVKVGNARAVNIQLNDQPPEAFSDIPGVFTREFKINT